MTFTWDPRKATSNLRKHGVTFDEARSVFDDPLALVTPDAVDSERFVILGESRRGRLLLVVYVDYERDDVVRILSARKATPHERKAYEAE